MTTPSTSPTSPTAHTDLGAGVDLARYDRGAQVLAGVDGAGGQLVVDALADIAPALAHHVVAYGFGNVYARPGLSPEQRQLVTIGILTALSGCEPQLEFISTPRSTSG